MTDVAFWFMQADGVNRGVGLRVEFSANEIAMRVVSSQPMSMRQFELNSWMFYVWFPLLPKKWTPTFISIITKKTKKLI